MRRGIERDKGKYEKTITSVMVMEESEEPRPTYRLIRGQYDRPDETEQLYPGVPALLPPLSNDAPKNRMCLDK